MKKFEITKKENAKRNNDSKKSLREHFYESLANGFIGSIFTGNL